jgi:predicted DNA-binding WGR domain protein
MERSEPRKNLLRFYCVDIQPTLFGDWSVTSTWGRIGTYGRAQQQSFSSLAEAEAAQSSRVAQKHRRGYR